MSPQFWLALLALSSLTAASDPGCEELPKPLEDHKQIAGKWIFHVGTSDNLDFLKELKLINSSWIKLSLIPDTDDITLAWGDKMAGKCFHGSVNSTFSSNLISVTFNFNDSIHEHAGNYLQTCPDCLLWVDSAATVTPNGEKKSGRNIYLFTKTGKLDASHLEVFKKQARCLNFPSDFKFGEITDMCPDGSEAASDVKNEEQ